VGQQTCIDTSPGDLHAGAATRLVVPASAKTAGEDRSCPPQNPSIDASVTAPMADPKLQTAGGKVLWNFTMSLDGFVAGPNHEMLDDRDYGTQRR
jgi:hypothetical protein